MARIFDVVEYPNEMRDEIVHREQGGARRAVGHQVVGTVVETGLQVA